MTYIKNNIHAHNDLHTLPTISINEMLKSTYILIDFGAALS